MKNYKGKKRERKIERAILAATIVLVLAIGSISPSSVIFAYDDSSEIINATFSETKAEDNMSATIHLNIAEKEDQEIQSIKLPDGSELGKDTFKRNDTQEILVDYKADKNSEYEYTVSYTEKKQTAETAVKAESEVITAPVLEEKITHEVTDLKEIDDFKLTITADDITFATLDKVDVMSGIVIKNEDDKDVTSSQTINIVDYGKLFSGLPGTYQVKYETLYSNNEKTYSFSRNITISEVVEKKEKSRAATPKAENFGISLSTGNPSFTDPKDFVIGKSDQETFNITVFYNDSTAELDRKLKVFIPSGFTPQGRLDSSSLDGASNIEYNTLPDGGTEVTITFVDGRTVVTGFDMNIKQDKKFLYDRADLGDQTYPFRVEQLVGATSMASKEFQIKTDKLTSDGITIDPFDKSIVDSYYRNIYISNGDEQGTITVKKKAFSDLSAAYLYLPKSIQLEEGITRSFKYQTSSVINFEIFAGDEKIESRSTIVVNSRIQLGNVFSDFKYAYKDMTLVFKDVLVGYSDGDIYSSPDSPYKTNEEVVLENFDGTKKNFGYFSVNPQLKEPSFTGGVRYKSEFFSRSKEVLGLKQGKRYEGAGYPLLFYINHDAKENLYRDFESTFEFPYTIQPFKLFTNEINIGFFSTKYMQGKASIELTTNKRIIQLDNTSNPISRPTNYRTFVDFEKDLQVGEYVSKVKIKSPFVSGMEFGFGYNIMDKAEDGSSLSDTVNATLKASLSSPQSPGYKKTYENSVALVKEIKKGLIPTKRSDKASIAVVGEEAYLGEVDFNGKFNISEGDLKIKYKSDSQSADVFSVTDRVIISTQYSPFETSQSFAVEYDTNLRSNLFAKSDGKGGYDFELSVGEYMTDFQIVMRDFENPTINSASVNDYLTLGKYFSVSLYSKKVPEVFPNSGKKVSGMRLMSLTATDSDGAARSTVSNLIVTFRGIQDYKVEITSRGFDGGYETRPDSGYMNELFNIDVQCYDSHKTNLTLDFGGTNKDLLSLIGSVFSYSFSGEMQYKTNFGRDRSINMEIQKKYDLGLDHEEYVTEMVFIEENFDGGSGIGRLDYLRMERRKDYPRTLPIDGAFIPSRNNGEKDPWDIKVESTQNDKKAIVTGSSIVVHATSSVKISGTSKIASVGSALTPKYQGQTEWFALPQLPIQLNDTGKSVLYRKEELYNTVRLENPTVYFIVDKNFSVNPDDINKQGQDIDIQFKDGVMPNGDSVLTFKFKNFEKTYRSGDHQDNIISIMNNIEIPTTVKLDAKTTKVSALKGMYYDLDDSIKEYNNYLSDLKKDDSRFAVVPELGDKSLYKMEVTPKDIQLLPLTEMGVAVTGQRGDAETAKNITGYDNEVYKQKLSIISNLTQPTFDWELYIPVPKKGKTVKYTDTSGVVDSPKAEYSMYLDGLLDPTEFPTGTKIEYTTDADPLYSLDGTSVGNYTESPANLKDVTMIHITIPKLEAKEKVFPTIKYKVDGEKDKVGKQIVLGGTYFNLKLGSEAGNYYSADGLFADRLSFALKDYVISGKVWVDKNVPANSEIDDAEEAKGLSDVTVKAIDKNKAEYTTKTALDGTYQISIPSNGKVDLVVNKPNDLTADPIQKYKSVLPTINNEFADKDDATSTASATLTDTDISYMNAGLWALPSVSVVGKEIIVKKGETVAVPAIAFPTDRAIIYGNSTDKNIATVSNDGKVTGVKVGTTKATVTVNDILGISSGDVTAEYTIKVIPDHGPTVTTDVINTFGSVGYDSKADIVIKDSIDEVININDTSKVTIDESKVDLTTPGKYPIIYTINDGYNEINYTRFVYVHGEVTITKPADKIVKQGTVLDPIEGATASYIHVNTDGTQKKLDVTVTSTSGTSVALPNIEVVTVPLYAEVVFGTVTGEANASYQVEVHGETTLTVANPVVTVKVGETMENIKKLVQASASMETPKGIVNPTINWDNFKDFDTTKPSNTKTATISTMDPDTGTVHIVEITIHVSKVASITAPDKTDTVVGDKFDPTKNITIVDGDGNPVVVAPGMISKNDIPVSTDGTSTTPGNYDVEYEYTDAYGNVATAKTTVRVHGALQFDDTRVDRIQTTSGATDDLNNNANLAKLAWYENSDGDKQPATFVKSGYLNPSINGRHMQEVTFKHPFKSDEQTFSRYIYTHGQMIINAPAQKVVKVGTEVNTVDGATATYIRANTDGTNETIVVPVTTSIGNTITSDVPTVVEVPLYAAAEPVPGLVNKATGKYKVVFNGNPEIRTAHDSIKVRVGSTPEEIKKLIQVQASVHYGKDALPTDITNLVNWDDLANVDTSVKKAEYTLKISVTDNDGVTVEKEIKILISDEIIMNLPNVDKVIGDTFDPFDGVQILDGNGNKVDSKDVTVDDSKVDMDNPGSYDVTYTYEDELGNKKTETNTIRVNGKIQIEGLDRIDLIEKKDVTYLPNSGKAFYIDYNKKKVDVSGTYEHNIDQGIVKKNEVLFNVTHPVSGEVSSEKQNIYVHSDIVFNQKDEEFISKVGSSVNTKDNYQSSYKHVNDDGSITEKNIPITGTDVTSDKVGYVDSEVSAKVEIVAGLMNEKKQNVKVAFNGLPFIQSASSLYFNGELSKEAIIKAMEASAGMKKADGIVVNLTSAIDFSDLNNVTLNKSGKYTVTITVKDQDGFVTYKDVEITIVIPEPEKPTNPDTPNPPVNPDVPGGGTGGNGNTEGDQDNGNNTNNGGNAGNGNNTNNGGNAGNGNNTNNGGNAGNGNNANNGGNAGNGNNTNNGDNNAEDVITVITKDIPKGKAENGITDELIKSYITANSKKSGRMDFEVVSNTVKGKVGTYEATIRFADGSERTLSIKVVDDTLRDVQQPEFGRDSDCFIQWILLLLLLGYSGFSITAILKRRQENEKLEKMLGKYSKNIEGEVNK